MLFFFELISFLFGLLDYDETVVRITNEGGNRMYRNHDEMIWERERGTLGFSVHDFYFAGFSGCFFMLSTNSRRLPFDISTAALNTDVDSS